MSRKQVCSTVQGPVKTPGRPIELTPDETQRLLAVFVEGKQSVLEEDCMVLLRWATEQRLRAALVEMMLEGSIRPVVKDGEVLVEAIV